MFTTYVTENKENYLVIYTYQVSCPLSVPLFKLPNCQSVLKYHHSTANCLYLHDSYVAKLDLMN